VAVACRDCEEPFLGNELFCEHCGTMRYPDLTRPTALATPEPEPVVDPWVPHALRFVGVGALLTVAWMTFILGLVWRMHLLSVTGYRKRDVLWLWVPVVGWIADARTLWRYTARDEYWTPRDDRPSHVLDGWARPAAITAGWLAVPALAVGGILASIDDDPFECVADDVEATMEAEEEFTFGNLGDAVDEALERCEVDVDFGGNGGPRSDE
jgi:hypothetical protein